MEAINKEDLGKLVEFLNSRKDLSILNVKMHVLASNYKELMDNADSDNLKQLVKAGIR